MKKIINEDVRFAFGRNWSAYLKNNLISEAIEISKGGLEEFLGKNPLQNKTFLDFGCGSGIHSLAALQLGAKKVVSIDFDGDSVKCCKKIKEERGDGYDWDILQGSLIDDNFVKSLGHFDVVYCWGVAHHTGDMNKALYNLKELTSENGELFVAIYNKVEGMRGSKYWWNIKRFYNKSSFFIKKIMELFYIFINFLKLVLRFKNPFRVMNEYKKKRGMNWRTDLIDWLGGFPYEYASPQEIFKIYHDKYGMELKNIKTTNYIGCNQFLFVKK